MVAPIRLAPEVIIGAPFKLFDIGESVKEFDVTAHAKGFVMIRQRLEAGRQRTLGARAELAGRRGADPLN